MSQTVNNRNFLMGNEAIARGAIEAGCAVATAYPGTPSSEILESLVKWKKESDNPIYVEWSINEKVAFEVAYGASLAGNRAMVAMKMVGLNVASDPFLSAAYLGVRAGLVVVVADDPGPHSSQTEQDSRFFAWFGKVPVLDPSTPAEAKQMAIQAFELSEKYEVPVILRPCLRVCHARQNVTINEPITPPEIGPFKKNWTRWAAIPKYRLVLHGELNEKLDRIRNDEPQSKPVLVSGNPGQKFAIITSGSVSSHVADIVASDERLAAFSIYKVDLPYPANTDMLQEIVDANDITLMIEETYPVLELQINDRRKIRGRLSKDVPNQGELTPELVEKIILQTFGLEVPEKPAPKVTPRRPSLCAGCPHRSAFYAIRRVFDNAVYSGDIGCYTLGINMGAVDTCLCMGASVGMAGGLGKSPNGSVGSKVVATIGDSTFYHAGVPALINAVHTRAKFVLVIMDNGTTAMTGGQPTPASGHLADGAAASPIDMEKLIQGCGITKVHTVDPYDYDKLSQILHECDDYTYRDGLGISVVITKRPCVRMKGVPQSSDRFEINDNCDRCMTCVRDLECPAISYIKAEKLMTIDEDMCAGCGFCAKVCPAQAIEQKR